MHSRPDEEIWNYQQIDLGFNYRMTDIQAALGLSQMRRLDLFVSKRHEIADRYTKALNGLPVQVQMQNEYAYSSYHLYVIRLKLESNKAAHRQVYEALRKQMILVNLHYIPIYLQPYYESLGFRRGWCPEAEAYYSEALSIPMYPGLAEEDQCRVIAAIATIVREAVSQ